MLSNHFHKPIISIKVTSIVNSITNMYHFENNGLFDLSPLNDLIFEDRSPSKDIIYLNFVNFHAENLLISGVFFPTI